MFKSLHFVKPSGGPWSINFLILTVNIMLNFLFFYQIHLTLKNTKRGRAIQLISQSRFKNGMRQLLTCSKSALANTVHVLCDIVRKESESYGIDRATDKQPLLEFNWDKIISRAKKLSPIILQILTAAVTKKHHQFHATKKKGKKIISLLPRIGSLMEIIGNSRKRTCNQLQTFVSLMMWLGSCKTKVCSR